MTFGAGELLMRLTPLLSSSSAFKQFRAQTLVCFCGQQSDAWTAERPLQTTSPKHQQVAALCQSVCQASPGHTLIGEILGRASRKPFWPDRKVLLPRAKTSVPRDENWQKVTIW